MTYPTRLSYDHPRRWYEKLWEREESFSFSPPPSQPDSIKAAYLNSYLRSCFTSHALRILNWETELDDESTARLTRDIRMHAIAAGKRVGVRFFPGAKATYEQVLDGELSLDWLCGVAEDVAEFAVEIWDPAVAQRRHDEAVRGGLASSSGLQPADLIPLAHMSIAAQAQALGCSPRKVSYLRAQLRDSTP